MLLEDISGQNYREDLIPWIKSSQRQLLGPTQWLATRGLDFDQYIANLSSNGLCDGLELWLISVLMGTALNVVPEDFIWCMVRTGVDLKEYPTLLLTRYGQAVWCRMIQESSEEAAPDPDIALAVAPSRKLPGRCYAKTLSWFDITFIACLFNRD